MRVSNESPHRIVLLPPPGDVAREPQDTSSTPSLFQDALAIRMNVFVEEQGCSAEEELDADDATSWHWVLYGLMDSGGGRFGETPAATIRLVPASTHDHGHDVVHGAEPVTDEGGKGAKMPSEPNYGKSNSLWDGKEPYAKIGRLATKEWFRGKGFAKALVQESLRWAAGHHEEVGRGQKWRGLILAHAQIGVEGWYRNLGWVKDEGMGQWFEEGIEHVGMWKRL